MAVKEVKAKKGDCSLLGKLGNQQERRSKNTISETKLLNLTFPTNCVTVPQDSIVTVSDLAARAAKLCEFQKGRAVRVKGKHPTSGRSVTLLLHCQ